MESPIGEIKYGCDNDDCWKKNAVQLVPAGKPADCAYCGWSMTPR